MKKINMLIMLSMLVISLSSFTVLAEEEHDFTEITKIIDSKLSCDNLTQEQIEEIGDYYMEQMHPGELHEIMDERMGGEGSETLKQVHINMAYRFYCAQQDPDSAYNYGYGTGMMSGGMMGGYGMMGSGMIEGYTRYGSGMMGKTRYNTSLDFDKNTSYKYYNSRGQSWHKTFWVLSVFVLFAVFSFIFSVIFWGVQRFFVKNVINEKSSKKR